MAKKYVYEVKSDEDGTLGFFTNIDKASEKAILYVSQDSIRISKKQLSPYFWEFESESLYATVTKHIVF